MPTSFGLAYSGARDSDRDESSGMIELRFAADDLLRVRFATSQAQEAVGALRALDDPAAHALHLPWIERARERLTGLLLSPLPRLVQDPYTPDFLTPAPATPLGTLQD